MQKTYFQVPSVRGGNFLWTDRLVILIRPVFHKIQACLVSLLANSGHLPCKQILNSPLVLTCVEMQIDFYPKRCTYFYLFG